ncbi:S-methyl-5'-thioadenosine phosphorylase isoform X2 [Condylostylus longicornis]|uniref:S-methyl-5'-thioadenosine phosphorylase isoform X2 n=1 Tax=Condylostylus longicornis TaxID=2530218 RepID=UPI00244DAED5|nr:S-methyl-5'-thioadenosine phosphorylase isoform X2 [Condylostylus longicornis]
MNFHCNEFVLLKYSFTKYSSKINGYFLKSIIGGSGLDDPDILDNRKEIPVSTPYGNPSDVIITGSIKGVPCALLARHGRTHSIMPSNVNYRGNIWALKSIGCTHLIVSTATGSLREDYKPGDLIIPNDFIDRTTKRHQTFYDGNESSPEGVCHLPMLPAYNERIRDILIRTAKELGLKVHPKATIVAIEGPRFSSQAESLMFRQWGGDLINMTTCPEVVLAKEAGLLYGSIAIATDYDCWREKGESVTVADVLKTFSANVDKVKKIIIAAVENVSKEEWTEDIYSLRKQVEDSVMKPHNK